MADGPRFSGRNTFVRIIYEEMLNQATLIVSTGIVSYLRHDERSNGDWKDQFVEEETHQASLEPGEEVQRWLMDQDSQVGLPLFVLFIKKI